MNERETRQSLDDAALRQAKTMLRTARHGALAMLDAQTGGPLASRISLATQPSGAPIFLISRLAPHFAALEADARCSLLLGEPGKGDPLAHPRMTIAGTVQKLTGDERGGARARFLARHPKAELYADFGDFAFWQIDPTSAAFYGGYAKAYDLTANDLLTPEDENLAAMEIGAVGHMNEDHLDAIKHYAEGLLKAPEADWRLAGLDMEGMDLIAGDDSARLWFDPPLKDAKELRPRLVTLAKQRT